MRDDITKLDLPSAAKKYARRSGLATLGPKGRDLYLRVNKTLINPTRPSTMKSVDAVGPVRHPGLKGSNMPKGGRPTKLSTSTSRIIGEAEDEFGPEDVQKPIYWSSTKFVKRADIPPGAKRVHLYPVQDVLKPRGSLQKESLSLDLSQKLRDAFDSWTSSEYGDSLSPEKVTSILRKNLSSEVEAAWEAFMDGQ